MSPARLPPPERESFDLIVSDLGLPDGDGFEIMRAIRARRIVPGIAMSGYGMDEDTAEAGKPACPSTSSSLSRCRN